MIKVEFHKKGTVVYALKGMEVTEYKIDDVKVVNLEGDSPKVRYYLIPNVYGGSGKGDWYSEDDVFSNKEEMKNKLLSNF